MKLILKYMKPYVLTILAIIVLIFIQAQAELNLPDKMSEIVTNGIQYGGITTTVPDAVTRNDMDVIGMFMDEGDAKKVLDNYTLVTKGTEAVVDNQEVRFTDDVYILKEDAQDLKDVMSKPMVFASFANSENYSKEDLEKLFADEDTKQQIMSKLEESTVGLEENFDSINKLFIQKLYANVGLSAEKIQSNYILHVGMVMLGISLVSILVQIASTYLATKTAAKIAAKMRHDVFKKVESFSSAEFTKFSTSSLITRTGNDITKIQQLCQMMMRMMLMAPMMGITAVFKVVKYPNISWILLIAIGIIIATMIFLLIVAVPKFEKIQTLTDKLNNVMREFLDGILVIRAFNTQKKEEEHFDETNSDLTKTDRFVSRSLGLMGPVMTFVMNGLTILIIWIASKQIDIDAMTIGDMMAFMQYAMHVVMSFMMVTVTFFMIPRSLVSAKRIAEVLDTENSIEDKKDALDLPSENGKIEFENVFFKYPGAEEYVLKDISFEANPGETVAFIGSTGSGKSTVAKLIPRLFDATEGNVKYCGINVKDLKQEQLHDKIGFASQRAILFSGTIESNVSFGRELSAEELDNAIDVSQSRNIVDGKEEGVKAAITQGGTNVSGGQKQRISIARALAKEESIYIFDDCFSALDFETDKKLRKSLDEMIRKTNSTVIMIAQRISTIKNADKIIVLEDGKIVGEGKHRDLLENCKVYKEIATSQLSEEELANASA